MTDNLFALNRLMDLIVNGLGPKPAPPLPAPEPSLPPAPRLPTASVRANPSLRDDLFLEFPPSPRPSACCCDATSSPSFGHSPLCVLESEDISC